MSQFPRHLPAALLLAGAALALALPLAVRATPIEMDGHVHDWAEVRTVARDPVGDVAAGQADLAEVRLAHDAGALYLMVDLTRESALQDPERTDVGSDLVLYLDLDADPATGQAMDGVGVDLEVRFGQRKIIRYGPAARTESINRLGAMSFPTHTAERFELRIPFATAPDAADPGVLIEPGQIRLFLAERLGGDRLPDSGALSYSVTPVPPDPPAPIPLARRDPRHLRVYGHNVERTSIATDPAPFQRILRALEPDIICYQEADADDITLDQAVAFVEQALPSPPGRPWRAVRVVDNLTLTRYPISRHAPVDGNLVCLVDLPDSLSPGDLALFNVHSPCCGHNDGRDREHDHIAATWRDFMAGDGPFPVDPGAPVIMTGDFNMVGYRRQLEALRDGRIIDPDWYGPSFAPARKAGSLRAAPLRHTHTRLHYTWRSDGDSFAPGRLDWLFYSPDQLALQRSFALWTPDMPADVLAAAGLHASDSRASDHLALVADFTFAPESPR